MPAGALGAEKIGIVRIPSRDRLERFVDGYEMNDAGVRLVGGKKCTVGFAEQLMIVQQGTAVLAMIRPIGTAGCLAITQAVGLCELLQSVLNARGKIFDIK